MIINFPATGAADTLGKIKTWLTSRSGSSWTSLRWRDGEELWASNTGNGRDKNVIIGMKVVTDATTKNEALSIRSTTKFTSGQSFEDQTGASPPVFWNLWGHDVDLWGYSNNRRVIFVAKVNTFYVSMYAGFYMPNSTPDEYPFPLYCGGNYAYLADPGLRNSANRMITSPGVDSAWVLPRDSSDWEKVANHGKDESDKDPINSKRAISIWPDNSGERVGFGSQDSWSGVGFAAFRPNIAGEFPAIPVQLYSRKTGELLGYLDGVYTTPGFGRVSEQTVKAGNVNYRLFQNVFRTGGNQFFAVMEI